MVIRLFLIVVCCLSESVFAAQEIIEKSVEPFPLSIIHMNDFHARFEETNTRSTSCKPNQGEQCIGGYARIIHTVKELLATRPNPLYLNAGDNFQGTLWYNIGRWNVTSQFLNLLNADAITLGNHEFDHAIEGVVPFLETIQSPMIVANIDDSEEPTMQGKYNKSIIIEKYGRKIGIIGVILASTNTIATTGRLKFLNESDAVRNEAAKMKEQGVNIIIVLSHCGLDVDYEIARNVGSDIDVIVGGHSHTFMYTGDNPPGFDEVKDNYPALVTTSTGHKVLIVQASSYTKYLGNITVYFDQSGNVISWDGAPIFMDSNVPQDEEILRALQPWKEIIDEQGIREIAIARTPLSRSACYSRDCNVGNFLTAAAVHHHVGLAEKDEWTHTSIAIVAPGGIRTSLNAGLITYADLIANMPFENTMDTIELQGKYLVEALEYGVSVDSDDYEGFSGRYMLQFTGLKVTFNVTKPVGNRVVSVEALCNKCDVPQFETLDYEKMYRIVMPSFLVRGGDGFDVFRDHGQNHQIGLVDNIIVEEYMKRMNPIMAIMDNRITVLT